MLVASVPVDTATFMLWLHQNLPPFCSQIEQVDEALEDICRADLMRADDDLVSRRHNGSCLWSIADVNPSGKDPHRRLLMPSI